MPTGKDLKRLVRARMKKTGESYTAARAQLLRKRSYAAIAGMSDASVKEATGCNWERWVKTLDKAGAAQKPHREIAKLVAFFGTPSWWTQMVTVGYERIRGLREKGQRRDGGYEASKSRTFDVPVGRVFAEFASDRARARWLDKNVTVKSATAPKRMRLAFPDGTSAIVGFVPRGPAKTIVAIQHEKLRDRAAIETMKKAWGDAFERLSDLVTS